mmetsp:Transcript_76859/g.222112  ORF Transcript_76859/g.222112 Transcript_76859/m.222112 type:complete len:251 (-) Transcript_76859:297-1049(-)
MLLDDFENRGRGEELVFDDVQAIDEMKDLGLAAAAAMHHAIDLVEQAVVAHAPHHWRIRAGRRQQQLGRRDFVAIRFDDVLQPQTSAVDQLARHAGVERLGELVPQALAEGVVTRGRQAVAADAAVVLGLIRGLPGGGEADDDVAGADARVVDDLGALHPASDRGVDDDRPHQVAHVGGLAASRHDVHSELPHLAQHLLRAVDQGRDHLARDQALVPADGARQENLVDGADAEQVVGVHDDRILGDALPH